MTALPYARPSLSEKPRNNARALLIAVLIFSALSLTGAIKSKGFLEADACTHYMFARHALAEPSYIVNVWGRPLCTGIYALPAAIGGLLGVRTMSLLLAVASALIAYRIAQNLGYRMPALAAILLFAQPLFFVHSFSELTEIPFAFVTICAFWAYQSRQFALMAILVGITPSGRPEGFGLIVLAALALVCHRKYLHLLLLPIPLMLWSYLGWVSWDSPADQHWYLWLKRNWPYAAKSAYGSGPWYHFIMLLPALLSPLIFPALIPGVALSLRRAFEKTSEWINPVQEPDPNNPTLNYQSPPAQSRLAFFADHQARCQFLVAFIPLIILFVHSVLWARGLMASNGELRYLLSVAPLWALLCAYGWEWFWYRFKMPAPFLLAALFATPPIFVNFYTHAVPFRVYDGDLMGKAAADWYKSNPALQADYPHVMASPFQIYYWLDLSQSNKERSTQWCRANVELLPKGTILFWDPIYGMSNSDRGMIVPKEDVEAAGWIWIGNVVYGGDWCNVYLSPQTNTGQPTDKSRFKTPGNVTRE